MMARPAATHDFGRCHGGEAPHTFTGRDQTPSGRTSHGVRRLQHDRSRSEQLRGQAAAHVRPLLLVPMRSHPAARSVVLDERGCVLMGRSRKSDPDYNVDPDRGSAGAGAKVAEFMDKSAYEDRAETRAGARELDSMIEGMPGLTRQQRDRERATPRGTTADIGHPAMERQLPAADSVRVPLSSRQRKARSVTKRSTQDRVPNTQHEAVIVMITDDTTWRRTNDLLSENVGDAQELPERDRVQVQRFDRAIQAFEQNNNRGHLVYANVEMPPMINTSSLEGFVRNNFIAGNMLEFDRYTGGAHTMHEVETTQAPHRTAVFEIQTRRGIYLGRSDSVDDTTHVLPRGVRFKIAGTHLARYQRPDGSYGRRQVIQLVDVAETEQGE